MTPTSGAGVVVRSLPEAGLDVAAFDFFFLASLASANARCRPPSVSTARFSFPDGCGGCGPSRVSVPGWAFHRAGSSSTAPARGDRFQTAARPLPFVRRRPIPIPSPRRLRRSYRRRGRQGAIVHPAEVLVELERRHRAGDVIQRALRGPCPRRAALVARTTSCRKTGRWTPRRETSTSALAMSPRVRPSENCEYAGGRLERGGQGRTDGWMENDDDATGGCAF